MLYSVHSRHHSSIVRMVTVQNIDIHPLAFEIDFSVFFRRKTVDAKSKTISAGISEVSHSYLAAFLFASFIMFCKRFNYNTGSVLNVQMLNTNDAKVGNAYELQ